MPRAPSKTSDSTPGDELARRWTAAREKDWGQASAQEALDALSLSIDICRCSALPQGSRQQWMADREIQGAICVRAIEQGVRLGEQPKGGASFAQSLAHQSPSVYQLAMASKAFSWRDCACWSGMQDKASKALWKRAPGAEGVERLAAAMALGGGERMEQKPHGSWNQARWDLAWWVHWRPQDQPAAARGALLGLEALAEVAPNMGPKELSACIDYAKETVLLTKACEKTAKPLVDRAEKTLQLANEKQQRQERHDAHRERSLRAWEDGARSALDADEASMLQAILSGVEQKWKGSTSTLGEKSLFEEPALGLAAAFGAKDCVQWLLTQSFPLGCAIYGKRPEIFGYLSIFAKQREEGAKGWAALADLAETAVLSEFHALGVDLDRAREAIEKASFPQNPSRLSKENKARLEAEKLAQTQRLGRAVARLRGDEAREPSSTKPPRL